MRRADVLPKVPKGLVAAVLLMTLAVLGLGGAVLALKLRPEGAPDTAAERNLAGWEEAVLADPKDDWAKAGLGLALLDAGRESEARRAFEDALELNRRNWVALFQLGVMVRESAPTRALTLLEKAAKFAPRTSKAGPLVAAGDLLLKSGQAERAKDAYRRAIADVPFLFDAHFGLARALEALGDDEGALEQYREAARYDPSNQAAVEAIARLEGNG